MKKTSKWYDPKKPDYYCQHCCELFQLRIGLGTICNKCLKPRRDEMHKLLIPHFENLKLINLEFEKEYSKRKNPKVQANFSERGKKKNKRRL